MLCGIRDSLCRNSPMVVHRCRRLCLLEHVDNLALAVIPPFDADWMVMRLYSDDSRFLSHMVPQLVNYGTFPADAFQNSRWMVPSSPHKETC